VLVALYPDLKMHPFQDIEVIYSGSQEKGLKPAGRVITYGGVLVLNYLRNIFLRILLNVSGEMPR
jgi:hypothetical protein